MLSLRLHSLAGDWELQKRVVLRPDCRLSRLARTRRTLDVVGANYRTCERIDRVHCVDSDARPFCVTLRRRTSYRDQSEGHTALHKSAAAVKELTDIIGGLGPGNNARLPQGRSLVYLIRGSLTECDGPASRRQHPPVPTIPLQPVAEAHQRFQAEVCRLLFLPWYQWCFYLSCF
jgi:hypothetical protein